MRTTLRNVAIAAAIPTLANAIALSDMTPRASGLPEDCQTLYTAQIAGCTPSDWTSTQCSTSCQNSLLALVGPMQKACGGQGIQGQNLVVAFLAGVGPQQLCHNIPSKGETTTAAPTTTTPKTSPSPTPSIVSDSTSTAKHMTQSTSLVADTTSRSSKQTTTKASTTRKTTAAQTTESSSMAFSTSSALAGTTTKTNKPASSPSKTTSSEGSSQTDFDDNSGGGSPFDTPGNLMNSASGFSVSAFSLAISAFAAVVLTTLS